ncbi:flavonoid 3',5'-hydroxylase 2-like [Rhododendron vialii]|uniref:flavonoid 3',5'-hydroxylase 2-like n=1 Tax=Rhododendron vialii TaxID=182163 RepID=UPI00265DAC3C|nr:flavonoid 3',5'-hydroxylase 2-like [Rhododendron vialii]
MAIDIIWFREIAAATLVFFLTRFFLGSLLLLLKPARKLPPGPKGWPVIGALPLLGTMPHVTLAQMAKKYGPIVYLKMGTCDMVVASTPASARAFLKTLDTNFSNRPPNAGATHLAYDSQDLVFADYGPKWTSLRKLCNVHMLGGKALDDTAHVRATELGYMLRAMVDSSKRGEPVVISELMTYAMANIVGQVTIGRRVFVTHGSESNEFKDMVVELMTKAGLFNVGDFIPAIAWMDLQGIVGRMKKMHSKWDALISKMVTEHAETAHDRRGSPDFLDVLMANREQNSKGTGLSITNIKALLLNLFTAGTDTSSSVIEWALAEMVLNPAILKRAQQEMDQVIGKDRRLQESDVPKLPYLQAICKETYRKHPSTPLNLPRISSEACEVNGYYVPKNTRLSVNIWAIGRDPDVWENPLEFDPERFMSGKNAKMDPRGNDFELIPFGAGRRICAGTRMGVVMVEYFLGTLVHSFDWKLPDGMAELNMDEAFGLALQKAVPLAAIVTPRLHSSAYAM